MPIARADRPGSRVCRKCNEEKPLGEFPWAQRTNRDGTQSRYQLRHCKGCERKKRRAWRERNKEDRRRYEREWRRQNPDRARAQDRKYNASAKGIERKHRYEGTTKGKAAHQRYRQRIKMLTADLPIEVVRPFVLRMLKEADAEYVSGGRMGARANEGATAKLAEQLGIPKHQLWDIAHKQRLRSVKVEVADKLAMRGDFSLSELYERAAEWAALTGSAWPQGYKHKRRRGKRVRCLSRTEREAQIVQCLAARPMDQAELAARLGYKETSGVSMLLRPMVAAGKLTKSKEPGCRAQKYRLSTAQGEES